MLHFLFNLFYFICIHYSTSNIDPLYFTYFGVNNKSITEKHNFELLFPSHENTTFINTTFTYLI